MSLKQPIGQKRLTNIAVVRLKKCGTRFEIACYKNKVFDWRQGSESDLDEVLQTTQVFQSVSKGVMAKDDKLKKAFGTCDHETICKEILAKGEVQVSDKERALQLESRLRDVATLLVEKCVDIATKRPLPHALVERALKDPRTRFKPDPRKSAKQQFLDVVPRLVDSGVLAIERARMRVQLTLSFAGTPESGACEALREDVHRHLRAHNSEIEREHTDAAAFTATVKLDPGAFRQIDALVRSGFSSCAAKGRLEVLDLAVHNDGDGSHASHAHADALAGSLGDIRLVSSNGAGAASRSYHARGTGEEKGAHANGDAHKNGHGAAAVNGAVSGAPAPLVGKFKCNSCRVSFDSKTLHREHFRSDWHRVNLKRKAGGMPPMSQQECEAIAMLEASAASDLSDYM